MSKPWRRVFAAVICVFATTVAAPSQVGQTADAKPLRFDVVSIRPSGSARGTGLKILPDGYEAMGMPLEATLMVAYVPAPYWKHLPEVKGAPAWVSSEKYDIQARVAPTDVAQWQSLNQNFGQTSPVLQQMLRLMLAERCNVRIHGIESTIDGYALRLRATKSPALVESSEPPVGDHGFDLIEGAKAVRSASDGEQVYTFYNTSMSVLASYLSLSSQSAVQDRTGLSGKYRFVLPRIASTANDVAAAAQLDLPFPWDLRAIGLKVDREKVKSTLWTVDSMEKPSPN